MDSKWELYLTTSFSLEILDSLHPVVVYSSCVLSSPTPHDRESNDHVLPSGYVCMTLTLTSPTPLSMLHSPALIWIPLGALTFGSLNFHGLAKMAFQCEFQNLS